jgi:hypothetical protein
MEKGKRYVLAIQGSAEWDWVEDPNGDWVYDPPKQRQIARQWYREVQTEDLFYSDLNYQFIRMKSTVGREVGVKIIWNSSDFIPIDDPQMIIVAGF